jgi:hypothetical protein
VNRQADTAPPDCMQFPAAIKQPSAAISSHSQVPCLLVSTLVQRRVATLGSRRQPSGLDPPRRRSPSRAVLFLQGRGLPSNPVLVTISLTVLRGGPSVPPAPESVNIYSSVIVVDSTRGVRSVSPSAPPYPEPNTTSRAFTPQI